ncbi:MAG: L-threonylcarbamoyladenylate synthase [Bacillota bacterium]|jgi:L-threonylcarbamoyladenylate synthase
METKWVKIEIGDNWEERYDRELTAAAELLKKGELVAFPTETVYGLGGNALLTASAEKIYAAKGRPSDNPLIVHVAEVDQVSRFARLDERAEKLMRAFCPAPLTCVLPKRDCISAAVTGGLNTVAVRIPDHPVAQALLKKCRLPVAAPSANLSGHPSPTSGQHVYHDLAGRIAMVLDSGSAGVGLESTVLDLTAATPVILRPGAVTASMLEPYLGEVLVGGRKLGAEEIPKAPGMKYKHYAPKGQVRLFAADELAAAYRTAADNRIAVLATADVLAKAQPEISFCLGRDKEDLAAAAHNLFAALRYCDEIGAEVIYAQRFSEDGIGLAVMNRLDKAAAKE